MSDELSREQVEMQVMLCQGPHSTQVRDGAASIILSNDAAQRAKVEALEATVAGYRHSIKIIGQRHDDLKAERDRLREAAETAASMAGERWLEAQLLLAAALRGEGG
jgi:hypothetical protein